MMSEEQIIWEAQFEGVIESTAPDSYDGQFGMYPPGNFVVSRNRDGSVASVYADIKWNVTAYNARGRRSILNFIGWCNNTVTETRREIVDDMRWLMFLLIWKGNGSSLSVGSLDSYMTLMNSFAQFAFDNNYRITEILGDASKMNHYLETAKGSNIRYLSSLLSTLIRLEHKETGFLVLGGTTLKELWKLHLEYTDGLKQHPPVPSRIYSNLISKAMIELIDFGEHADRYLKIVKKCSTDKLLGRCYAHQTKITKAAGMVWSKANQKPVLRELLDQHDLTRYFEENSLSRDMNGLSKGLSHIQYLCQLIIHIYSGARREEIMYLPFHCVEEQKRVGQVDFILHGQTTKFSDGRLKRARWVTSLEAVKAIQIAQKVASIVYSYLGDDPKKMSRHIEEHPLFVCIGYLPFVKISPEPGDRKYAVMRPQKKSVEKMRIKLLLPIEDQDICELERIDPHRAWRSEPRYHVGQLWPLTTHQLRRSLALYAANSGLVSLPTLRRQLQHITEEMTRYYAKGSALANDIIGGDEKHFGRTYQDAQPESQALAYIANVLFSDEQLFGAHGAFVVQKKKGQVRVLNDRDKTFQKFRKGEMAYRETILGGCTEVDPCDKKALRSIIGCLDCKRSILKLSKLNRVIAAQENLVQELNPDTIEYRTEKGDLGILLAAKERFESKLDGKEPDYV